MSAEETVLVEALVDIEHNRETHVPGTKSAHFLVPLGALASLLSSGAVKQAAVVDVDALLASETAAAVAQSTAPGQVVSFADVADQIELERVTAELAARSEALAKAEADYAAAHAERVDLGEQLATTQAELVSVQALLAEAKAALEASAAEPDSGAAGADTGTAGSTDQSAGAGAADVVDTTKATAKASKAAKA